MEKLGIRHYQDLSLQRYLTRRRLHTPFSVRQKGAVVALLPPSYQVEDVLKRQGF